MKRDVMFLMTMTMFLLLSVSAMAQFEIRYNQIDDDGDPATKDDDFDGDGFCVMPSQILAMDPYEKHLLLQGRQCSSNIADCNDADPGVPYARLVPYVNGICYASEISCVTGAYIRFCVAQPDNRGCPANTITDYNLPTSTQCHLDGATLYRADLYMCNVDYTREHIVYPESQANSGCVDGKDNDCDGLVDFDDPDCSFLDDDNDHHIAEIYGGDDCCDLGTETHIPGCNNANKGSIHGGGIEAAEKDGIDSNCNGLADEFFDSDGDGIADIFEDPGCKDEVAGAGDVDPATGCLLIATGWS